MIILRFSFNYDKERCERMYWYFFRCKSDSSENLINFFNSQQNTFAFIPKTEKWYSINGVKSWVVKNMYPDYVFVRCDLDEISFMRKYKEFLESVKNSVTIVNQGNSLSLQQSLSAIYDKLFNGEDTIRHSVGNIVNSKLIVDTGPIMGLEDYVIKINRHHRIAMLDFRLNNSVIKVPLEVVSKS